MSFAAGSRWRGELRDGDGETSVLELSVHTINEAGAFSAELKVAKTGRTNQPYKIRGFATLDDSGQIGDYATIGMLVDDGSGEGSLTISEFMKPQKVAKYTGTLVGDSIDGDWNEVDAGGDFSLKYVDPASSSISSELPPAKSVRTPKGSATDIPKPPPTPPAPAAPAAPPAAPQPQPLPSPSLRNSVDRGPPSSTRDDFHNKAGADDEVVLESSPTKPPPTPPAPVAPPAPAAPPPKPAKKEEDDDYDFSNVPAQKLVPAAPAAAPATGGLLPPTRSKHSKPPDLETITEAEHSYVSEASPMKGVPPSPAPKGAPAGGAKALHFDGSGGAVLELPGDGSLALSPSHDFTIALSVRREEGRGGVLVARAAPPGGGVAFVGGLHPDGRVYFLFRAEGKHCLIESIQRAPAGAYVDIAFVKEQHFAALHMDGQEENTREFDGFGGQQLCEPLFVGGPGSQAAWEALVAGVEGLEAAPRFLCGRLRHLSVWERPLEPSECLHAATAKLVGGESGLCALYKFAGGSPAALADATSHENNAKIRGATWADAEASGLPVLPEREASKTAAARPEPSPAPAPAPAPAAPPPPKPAPSPPPPPPPEPEPSESVKNIKEKVEKFKREMELVRATSSENQTPARGPSPVNAPSSSSLVVPPAGPSSGVLTPSHSAPQPSSSPSLAPPAPQAPPRAASAPNQTPSPRSAPPSSSAFQPPAAPAEAPPPRAAPRPPPEPVARSKRLEEWGVEEVGAWLDGLGLSQYRRVFAESAVDGSLLAALQDSELREALEVENAMHLKKMRMAIEQHRDRSRPAPFAAPSPPGSGPLPAPVPAPAAAPSPVRPSSAGRPASAGRIRGAASPARQAPGRPQSAGPRRSASDPAPPPPAAPAAPAPPPQQTIQPSSSDYGPFVVPARKPTASDMAALQLDDKKGAWVYCKPKNSWIYVLRQEVPPAPPGEGRPGRRRPASAGAGERAGPYKAGRPASKDEAGAPAPVSPYADAVNPALVEIQRQLGLRPPGGPPPHAPPRAPGGRKPRPASAKARLESPTKQHAWAAAGEPGRSSPSAYPESRRGRVQRQAREEVIHEDGGPDDIRGAQPSPPPPGGSGGPLLATPDERLQGINQAIADCEREDGEPALLRRIELCVERLALCQLKYGEKHQEIVKAHWRLAESYMDGGLFEQSIQHALSARDINIAIGSDESRRIHPEILLTLGLCYTRSGQLSQARAFLTKSLKYSTTMFGDSDKRVAPVHMALAAVEKRETAFDKAIQHLLKAKRIKEAFLGDAPEVRSELADISVLLAKVYAAKEDDEEALVHFQEALRGYREAVTDEKLPAADRKQNEILGADTAVRVGKIHMRAQDFRSAEPFFKEALGAYEREFTMRDVRSIAVRRELGLLYVKWRRFAEAQSVLKLLLQAERHYYGPDSVKPADTARVLGTVYLADQRLPEALEMYQTVLRVYKAEYGARDRRVKSIAARVAEVREQLVKQTAAEVDKSVGSPHLADGGALAY